MHTCEAVVSEACFLLRKVHGGSDAVLELLNRRIIALQEAVREWLDRMAASWPSALPRTDAARAPEVQYLVPEVADGRVSSGSLG